MTLDQEFNLNDPPKDMYFAYKIGGKRAGKDHIKLTFGKPVLGFTQARHDSDDWYIVTIRNSVIKDEFNFYYTDADGIMLELYPLVTNGDIFKADSTGATSTLFFNGDRGFHETLEIFYQEARIDIASVKRDEVDYEDVYDFLELYKPYIEDNIPHILI